MAGAVRALCLLCEAKILRIARGGIPTEKNPSALSGTSLSQGRQNKPLRCRLGDFIKKPCPHKKGCPFGQPLSLVILFPDLRGITFYKKALPEGRAFCSYFK